MKNRNIFLPFFMGVIIFILLFILFFKGCKEPTVQYEKRVIYKDRIITLTKQEDSTKTQVKKQDTIRIKYIVKWRELKADTIYKECQELKIICDTIIAIDSTEIASLKHVVLLSDSIIGNQKKIIQEDSLEVLGLKKQIRKHRRQKALLTTGLIVVGAGAIYK